MITSVLFNQTNMNERPGAKRWISKLIFYFLPSFSLDILFSDCRIFTNYFSHSMYDSDFIHQGKDTIYRKNVSRIFETYTIAQNNCIVSINYDPQSVFLLLSLLSWLFSSFYLQMCSHSYLSNLSWWALYVPHYVNPVM